MRTFYLLAFLTLLCTCVRAQGIVIDLTGAGAGNQPTGNCDSGLAFPNCFVHDGNQEFSVGPGGLYGVYFEWSNTGAVTFSEVRGTDQMGNPVFPTVTEPLSPGFTVNVTNFLEAPETPGVYDVLVTVTATDDNDREDTQQFRYFITVDAALPVSWSDVRAETTQKGIVDVYWQVASEEQNEAFFVERSLAGQAFTQVGAVAGAGSGQGAGTYHFRDESAPAGVLFYRVRQRDFDGEETVSPVVSIVAESTIIVFPNPVADRLFVRGLAEDQAAIVFDGLGRRVATFSGSLANGLDVSGLRAGRYWVRVGEEFFGVLVADR